MTSYTCKRTAEISVSGPVPGGVEPALQLAGAAVGEVAATVRGGSTGYLVLCTSTYTGKKTKILTNFVRTAWSRIFQYSFL